MASQQDRGAGRFPVVPGSFRARAILLVALLLLVSGLTFDPKLYISGDNVDYILLAQKAWREGDLWGSAKYPPLFPLLLVPLQILFGTGPLAGKILATLCYAAAGIGLLWLAERAAAAMPGGAPMAITGRDTPTSPRGLWTAFTVTGAAMLAVPLVEFSHYVMSEIPFLLASVIALWLGERAAARATLDARALLPWALAAGAAFYVRTVGVAVLAALPLVLLLRRRWRPCAVSALLCAAVLVPWLLHSALGSGEGESYLEQIRYVNPYLPERGLLDLPALADRFAQNARQYFGLDIALALVPYAYSSTYAAEITSPPALPAWGGALVGILLGCAMMRTARRLPVTVAYTALFLGVCLAWPPIWASVRFVLPILPFCFLLAALGLWDGWAALSARLPALRRPGGFVLAAVLAGVLLLSGQRLMVYAQEVRRYPSRWDAYFTALHWARDNLSPREVVLDRKPNIFQYVTGLEAVSFPREAQDARMLDFMRRRGVTVAHVSSIPYEDVLEILHPFVQRQARYFEPLWYDQVPGGGFGAFLRFHPEGYHETAPGESATPGHPNPSRTPATPGRSGS